MFLGLTQDLTLGSNMNGFPHKKISEILLLHSGIIVVLSNKVMRISVF